MEDKTFLQKWKTWIQTSIAVAPLIIGLCTAVIWVDHRFVPKTAALIQHIDTQILIINGHLRDYNRLVDQGMPISSQDRTNFELDKLELQSLKSRKAKAQGLAEE